MNPYLLTSITSVNKVCVGGGCMFVCFFFPYLYEPNYIRFHFFNTNMKTKVSKVMSLKIMTFNCGLFKCSGDI